MLSVSESGCTESANTALSKPVSSRLRDMKSPRARNNATWNDVVASVPGFYTDFIVADEESCETCCCDNSADSNSGRASS